MLIQPVPRRNHVVGHGPEFVVKKSCYIRHIGATFLLQFSLLYFLIKAWLMNASVKENIVFGQAFKPGR